MTTQRTSQGSREILSERELLKTRQFTVSEFEYLHPSGQRIVRSVVRHPGAVVVIPLMEDGRILLVRQFRSSVNEYLLEFPAGTLEPGEPPLVTAQRELAEEVHRAAQAWDTLGTLFPAPGFCDEVQHFFIARELSTSFQEGDEDEEIEIVEMKMSEIELAIAEQKIRDGKTLAGLSLARAKGRL